MSVCLKRPHSKCFLQNPHPSPLRSTVFPTSLMSMQYRHTHVIAGMLDTGGGSCVVTHSLHMHRSDMHRWLAAFPDPENMERETNEVVYKDWGELFALTTTLPFSLLGLSMPDSSKSTFLWQAVPLVTHFSLVSFLAHLCLDYQTVHKYTV